jgi:hypothetical protein
MNRDGSPGRWLALLVIAAVVFGIALGYWLFNNL